MDNQFFFGNGYVAKAGAPAGKNAAERNGYAHGTKAGYVSRGGAGYTPRGAEAGNSIVLSPAEAEEYCAFKRQKRVEEVLAALKKTVISPLPDLSPAALKKCAEEAKLVQCPAVRVPPNKAAFMRGALSGSGAVTDCVVGGNGETTAKVKKYETKQAVLSGAGRITLILSPAAVKTGKWGEVKKDIKKVRRAAKKRPVIVALPEDFSKTCDTAVWKKIADLTSDCGGKYISVPFSQSVLGLRALLKDACMLEVTGVENTADFKALIAAGAESIGVIGAEKIRAELLNEAENCSFAVPVAESSFFSSASVQAERAAFTPAAAAGAGQDGVYSEKGYFAEAEKTETAKTERREEKREAAQFGVDEKAGDKINANAAEYGGERQPEGREKTITVNRPLTGKEIGEKTT